MEYQPFHFIAHTADIQVALQGRTWNELLANAVKATFSLTRPHLQQHALPSERTITVHGTDREILLVKFLSECLYYSTIYHEIYNDFRAQIATETTVQGTLVGHAISTLELEIKAITYHELSVTYSDSKWHALITYDI